MFYNYVFGWLNNALDYGLRECDFWDMTLAEITRFIESKQRIQKKEAQEKASYDYILADLIGRSISRIHSSQNKLPSIQEAYPTLFDSAEIEEKVQVKRDEASVARLKQFAQIHNKKYREVEVKNDK